MDYNFLTLNSRDFEHLIQSLTQNLLGNNSIVFGDGPDGARELIHHGISNFPNQKESWDGYWVVQAKFKSRTFVDEGDFEWIRKQFITEMAKFQDNARNLETPNNYLFFTNAKLTPTQDKGGRDKMETLKKEYTNLIPNIYIASYDELCKLLDNNRDVATAYSSFILSGDILSKLYKLLDFEETKKENTKELILRYLEKSFNSDLYSKLIQAGDLTNQINIEKVFIDIDVVTTKNRSTRIKFLNHLINLGNRKYTSEEGCKLVLVGGAGSGKSTLSQFASQVYTAFFVFDNLNERTSDKIKTFLNDFSICEKPNCLRYPFKIVLKDFASWIKEQNEKKQSQTLLKYIQYRIETIGDGEIGIETLRKFLANISSLFIFDGLDEVPVTSNRNEVLKEINDFIEIELKNQFADAIILCTTRQQGYTKEFDENIYDHYFVSDLSNEDCLNYLEKLLSNIERSFDDRESYLKTLKEALLDDVTGRLMRTPLQATIMTILVKSGGKPSRNKYNLFKEYYDTIYKRELQKELLPILKEYRRNIDDIHALLGFELQVKSEGSDNPSALFESSEFQNLIRLYLKKKEEWEEKDIDSFLIKIKNAVTERLVFIGEIQDSKIGFVIRSLQEYFAANYIINFNDDLVLKNLKDIANSSYWRNTFLFAVSGLHNTKNHLIDQVYLHCERLNGTEESINVPNIYNSIFFGSWLSLEILSEGIFSDSPKNRNRFIQLLDKLFTSVNAGDLSKTEFLPHETLIDVILKKYITEVLISSKEFIQKYASYKLAFSFLRNSILKTQVEQLLYETWDEKYEYELFNLIDAVEITNSNIFLDKLYIALLKDDYFKYADLLDFDVQFGCEISRNLVEKFNFDKKLLSRLVEINFLNTLGYYGGNRYYNIFSLFNSLLGKDSFKLDQSTSHGILSPDYKFRKSEIVEGYSLSIVLMDSENFHLDYFTELFNKYSISYLDAYIQLIRNPSIDSFVQFFHQLKNNGNDEIFQKICKFTKNWLFNHVTSGITDISQIDNLLDKLNSLEFGDYSDWLLLEKKILSDNNKNLLVKSAVLYTRSIDTKNVIIGKFYDKFKDDLENDEPNSMKYEFLRLLVMSYEDGLGVSVIRPSIEIVSVARKIFDSIEIHTATNWQLHIYRSAVILMISQINGSEFQKMKSYLFELFDYSMFEDSIEFKREIYLEALNNCIVCFNSNEIYNSQVKVENVITFILQSLNEIPFELIENINFKEKGIQGNESSYRIILRLITLQLEVNDIDKIINILSESNHSNKIYLVVCKLFLSLKINENWSVEFFLRVYNKVTKQKKVDITLVEKIELYLKFADESKMTNMKNLRLSAIKS